MNRTVSTAGIALTLAVFACGSLQAAPPPAPAKATAAPAKSEALKATNVTSGMGVGEGDLELSIFGNITSTDGNTFTFVGSSVGYYIRNNIQLLGSASGFVASEFSDLSFVFGANYLFSPWKPAGVSNPMVPYVGAGISFGILEVDTGFGTYSETSTDPAVRAGLKQFIGERISVNYELEYTLSDPASTEFKVGVSFYL